MIGLKLSLSLSSITGGIAQDMQDHLRWQDLHDIFFCLAYHAAQAIMHILFCLSKLDFLP